MNSIKSQGPFGNGLDVCPVCGKPSTLFIHTTNLDRVRVMTAEELAVTFGAACPNSAENRCCQYYMKGTDGCTKCWLDWLKQEAKDD